MRTEFKTLLSQAADRMLQGAVNLLPGLLALMVILLVTAAIIAILRVALRRLLSSVDFDERVVQWGFPELAEWSPHRSPSALLIRILSWTVFVLGLLVGISSIDAALPSRLVIRLFEYIPNVLAAAIVLALGSFAARFLGRSVLISAVNMRIQSARLLSLGVKWLILVLSGAMALEHLGIGGNLVTLSFGILFGGIVLALALAVGLGSKDMVSRSWEQQSPSEKDTEEHVRHL
jgi:hypothetical protein